MDKSFLIFVVMGIGFLYVITNFIGDIQEKDDSFRNSEYEKKHQYDTYTRTDSIGRDVLVLIDVDEKTQLAAWNEGKLKEEFLDLYPDFSLMKDFINNRVKGEPIKSKLLKLVDETEAKFFSGTVSSEEAKHSLEFLK